ncbi:MAG TPA: ATP-binding protein [Burkholderiales bacterium]|nr:ATP-binding protein [Burkholderiales bacterium]
MRATARPANLLNPALAVTDAQLAWWLGQASLRLRREVCWCWHQRTGGPAPGDGRLPPLADPAQESLDLTRHQAERERFFADDVTARYLGEQLAAHRPAAAGRWSRLAAELRLSDAAQFLLALGLAARVDAALGPVCAAVANDLTRPYPTLALAQRLWDDAMEVALAAHAGHPLFTHGLLAAGWREAPDWQTPLEVPAPVAGALLHPGALPEGLSLLRTPAGDALTVDAAATAQWLAAHPPRHMQIVPLLGARGTDYGEGAAACSAKGGRACARLGDEISSERGSLLPLASSAWLAGLDLLVPEHWAERAAHAEPWFGALAGVPVRCYLPINDTTQLQGIPSHALAPVVAVAQLGYAGRAEALRAALGLRAQGLEPAIAEAARRFRFQKQTLDRVTATVNAAGARPTPELLLAACRAHGAIQPGTLAQRVEPRFGLDELVLPASQARQVAEIVRAMRALTRVHYQWGAARAWNEGGLSVLFAGGPGTGKTMAAEAIGRELALPLYRVDLSQVVNKYIGETEKNLKQVFDAAEASDVVLFFDEADALFGRRTDVKDAHDRFANIEVSYLLERMERFKGLAILSTNRRKDLDEAFTRRLRYIVEFPMPGEPERRRIWEQAFPSGADISALDLEYLAEHFELSGGHIRSIALNACLQCAGRELEAGEAGDGPGAVGMPEVLTAVRRELEKMGRPAHAGVFGRYAGLAGEP